MAELMKTYLDIDDIDEVRKVRPAIRHQDPREWEPILKLLRDRKFTKDQMLKIIGSRVLGKAHEILLTDDRFRSFSNDVLLNFFTCGSFMVHVRAHALIYNFQQQKIPYEISCHHS